MTIYRQLDSDKTVATMQQLSNRISERFPDSSLCSVGKELLQIASESKERIRWIERPHLGLRLATVLVIILSLTLVGLGVGVLFEQREEKFGLAEGLGAIESVVNEAIVLGAALLFLLSLEVRLKRTRSLQVLHDLRAMSHVIDMHQLTKDPSQVLNANAAPTQSSPKRVLTPFQLSRYLDYCSELLSLIGKLAALYAQSLPDAVVVSAVNDIEILTTGLSRKIWQKIVMVDESSQATAKPVIPKS